MTKTTSRICKGSTVIFEELGGEWSGPRSHPPPLDRWLVGLVGKFCGTDQIIAGTCHGGVIVSVVKLREDRNVPDLAVMSWEGYRHTISDDRGV